MIVVAGGSGTRMGTQVPKQFLVLNGKPILMHTLENLHRLDEAMQLILVLPQSQIEYWTKLKTQHQFYLKHELAIGGTTRFLSVKSGLALANGELIGVHDGVRPFLSKSTFDHCFQVALQSGAAVPATKIVQSLRKVDDDGNSAVDREDFRAIQTPQCFKASVLKTAFSNVNGIDFSDDASVVEANGQKIELVEGDEENIKITTPFDLQLAELIISGLPN